MSIVDFIKASKEHPGESSYFIPPSANPRFIKPNKVIPCWREHHNSSKTTEIYTLVSTKSIQQIKSAFDDL